MSAPRFQARNDLLTPKRVAELTGLPVRTIRHLLDTRKIPYEVVAVESRPRRRVRRSVALALLAREEREP